MRSLSSELSALRGPGFAASPDFDAAVAAAEQAHASGVAGIVEIIGIIKMLLPFFQDNLPALLDLLMKWFGPKV